VSRHRSAIPNPQSPGRPIRIGVSSCLLGNAVRYDGGHKRDRYITDILGRFFEFVPVCPEVELGLGTPRETLRLAGDPTAPRLVFQHTRADITERMRAWAARRIDALARADLSGYILKSDSPSCGMEGVRVYPRSGVASRHGVGLFARALMERLPELPVEEEGRLHDPAIRENFIERVFCYRRWRDLGAAGLTRGKLVAFHAAHELVLRAHSPKHLAQLGRLVGRAKARPPRALGERYGALLMAGLRVRATPHKHASVLRRILGRLERHLDGREAAEVLAAIEEYRGGRVPLVAPLTLLKHHLARHAVPAIRDQVYLNPHPQELMLRNHA
jgi:uncharacterized protein YbgA (DUF1722 family)/uncharacterized protein YbbK (DUF523 family)